MQYLEKFTTITPNAVYSVESVDWERYKVAYLPLSAMPKISIMEQARWNRIDRGKVCYNSFTSILWLHGDPPQGCHATPPIRVLQESLLLARHRTFELKSGKGTTEKHLEVVIIKLLYNNPTQCTGHASFSFNTGLKEKCNCILSILHSPSISIVTKMYWQTLKIRDHNLA